MKIGLHIPDFTWTGGDAVIGARLAEVARTADEAGFDQISVMDHFFQIHYQGPADQAMLEAYTALGFLAAHTERAKLMTLVTGAIYRHPGILAKQVTTLDVLSGGRAWLGVGAGWNEEESRGLGIPFPPLAERFERLEEAVQICLQMWSDDESPYHGEHFHLERTLNSPQALSKPDRRRRREEDAPTGGQVRAGVQRRRRSGRGAQAGSAARALRTGGTGLRRDREDRRLPVRPRRPR
jgi:alkanesulfonate monooxygenase SsuD/methylene tetrahydromethanopterin reductase-like flavin-dependent oxidoreductase (luciferase family)